MSQVPPGTSSISVLDLREGSSDDVWNPKQFNLFLPNLFEEQASYMRDLSGGPADLFVRVTGDCAVCGFACEMCDFASVDEPGPARLVGRSGILTGHKVLGVN